MAFDTKDDHAREFTDIERLTLRVWFDLDLAGNDELAERVLDTGIQFEHYTSLLDNDADKRTPAELNKQARLKFLFDEQLNHAAEFFRQHKGEDDKGYIRVQQGRERIQEISP